MQRTFHNSKLIAQAVCLFGLSCASFLLAQEEPENERMLRVPIQTIGTASTPQPFMNGVPGYIPPTVTAPDAHSHYRKSSLGKWQVPREVDRTDSSFHFQIATPDGNLNVTCNVFVDGKPFREIQEALIDNIIERSTQAEPVQTVATKEPAVEPEIAADAALEESEKPDDKSKSDETEIKFTAATAYSTSSEMQRLIAYARSRKDRLTRYELRRRLADLTGGPSIVFSNADFGTERHDLLPLFALLDVDEDAAISRAEANAASDILSNCDANSDGSITKTEILQALDGASPRREVWSPDELWTQMDADDATDAEQHLSLRVSFGNLLHRPGLFVESMQWMASPEPIVGTQKHPTSGESKVVLLPGAVTQIAFAAAQQGTDVGSQIALGVVSDGYALLRAVDRDGDWRLTDLECQKCAQKIRELDLDGNGSLKASEIPTLLRVCVTRGAQAHQALASEVVVRARRAEKSADPANNDDTVAPDWFASMDLDNDNILTRDEFLGGRERFSAMDVNQDDMLSPSEAAQSGNQKDN